MAGGGASNEPTPKEPSEVPVSKIGFSAWIRWVIEPTGEGVAVVSKVAIGIAAPVATPLSCFQTHVDGI